MKVCVYAICKNEIMFIKRWVESMSEADAIYVTDTGSTDGTPEALRALGINVHNAVITPWRFDIARNISLGQVPEDADICVCTDLDEVFEPEWRKALEAAWTQGTSMTNYIYNWSVNTDGSPGVQFMYFKIHNSGDYTWRYPVHEVLTYTGSEPERKVFAEGVTLNHFPDDSKSRGSYLPLLELAAAEEPLDSRMAYYLARKYMFAGKHDMCIKSVKRYLELPGSYWDEERAWAAGFAAESYSILGNYAEAYCWRHRAISEAPQLREPYAEFAKTAYTVSDWETALAMSTKALSITEKSKTFVNSAGAWGSEPYDINSLACYWLEMYERALKSALLASKIEPDNSRIIANVRLIRQKLK